jgi:hypothetical protein
MSKTYSIAFQTNSGVWVTNWNQYNSLEDINWEDVDSFSKKGGYLAYGYYYGTNSRELTSPKCRTIVKDLQKESKDEATKRT